MTKDRIEKMKIEDVRQLGIILDSTINDENDTIEVIQLFKPVNEKSIEYKFLIVYSFYNEKIRSNGRIFSIVKSKNHKIKSGW